MPQLGYTISEIPLPVPGYAPAQVPLPEPGYTMGTVPLPAVGFAPPPPAATPTFPTHRYARSPRDYFMWNEALEDQVRRESRPALVP